MSLRVRGMMLGGAAGAVGATSAVAASAVLGPTAGAAVGMLAAGAMGALATLAAMFGWEERTRAHLVALEQADPRHPEAAPPPFEIAELDELAEGVRKALQRERTDDTGQDDVVRKARSLWTSLHGSATPAPEGVRCIAAVLDLFRDTADTLRRLAASLEESNERMAHGALDQTETVVLTTSSVEAISEKIDRISQNSENATEACERTRQEARRGLELVHRVVEGMDRLRAQIDMNGRKVRRLGDRSVEIGTIVELIRGISSRTDMLALNATIESVRAGEHGRGFAVVAEEIRKLAERTAAATRDISALVEAIQADTHESIRALGEEQTEMDQQSQRVRDTGAALERISQMAESSAQLVDGISRSTNDQVVAAQELVRAMQRISDVSHLTLERSNQSRESIRSLTQWCERLTPIAGETSPAPEGPPAAENVSWNRPLRVSKTGSSVRILR